MSRKVLVKYVPSRTGDVRDSWADVSQAVELLGYEPSVGLEEGLQRTAEALLAPQRSR